jgi:catechol 2,3-dioxygenase-like lactoylglutathione lyase family enzyme
MSVSIRNVGIDTNALARAAAFWQSVTGYKVSSSSDSDVYLTDPAESGPGLSLLVVPEPKSGKNRLHLDLYTGDLDGEVSRITGLGASEVGRFDGWVVLADPDGNQFCVIGE